MPVNTTDGEFGELVDIIVDPAKRSATHVIVEPFKKHYQARLVPIWLVASCEGALHIALDLRHLRQLQRVSATEFVPVVGTVDLAVKWDVGSQPLKKQPVWDIRTLGLRGNRDDWSPIPKGECEIRRNSKVVGSKGRTLGTVDGLIADHDQIVAVVVTTGVAVFRQQFVVPVDLVEQVSDGLIVLSINRMEFEDLERLEHESDNGSSVGGKVARKVSRVNAKLGSRIFVLGLLTVIATAGCSGTEAASDVDVTPTTEAGVDTTAAPVGGILSCTTRDLGEVEGQLCFEDLGDQVALTAIGFQAGSVLDITGPGGFSQTETFGSDGASIHLKLDRSIGFPLRAVGTWSDGEPAEMVFDVNVVAGN